MTKIDQNNLAVRKIFKLLKVLVWSQKPCQQYSYSVDRLLVVLLILLAVLVDGMTWTTKPLKQ
jgi:hypothetical protein